MTWGEVQRLTVILLKDPASEVSASVRGWQHPLGREAITLRDMADSFARVNFKKPTPYPRPWDPQPKRFGGVSLSPAEFQAIKQQAADQN